MLYSSRGVTVELLCIFNWLNEQTKYTEDTNTADGSSNCWSAENSHIYSDVHMCLHGYEIIYINVDIAYTDYKIAFWTVHGKQMELQNDKILWLVLLLLDLKQSAPQSTRKQTVIIFSNTLSPLVWSAPGFSGQFLHKPK